MGKISMLAQEIDKLLQSEELIINSKIQWKQKKDQTHYKFKSNILSKHEKLKGNLTLTGTKNPIISDYSFALLFEKERIRGLDPSKKKKHTFISKGKQKTTVGVHKHKYTDDLQDGYTYVPDDITDPSDIEKTFMEFLNECNIKFKGKFEPPPKGQLKLPV